MKKEKIIGTYDVHLNSMANFIKNSRDSFEKSRDSNRIENIKKIDKYIFDANLNKDDIQNMIFILDDTADSHVKAILGALYTAYEQQLFQDQNSKNQK